MRSENQAFLMMGTGRPERRNLNLTSRLVTARAPAVKFFPATDSSAAVLAGRPSKES